jgi:hypothetical protein
VQPLARLSCASPAVGAAWLHCHGGHAFKDTPGSCVLRGRRTPPLQTHLTKKNVAAVHAPVVVQDAPRRNHDHGSPTHARAEQSAPHHTANPLGGASLATPSDTDCNSYDVDDLTLPLSGASGSPGRAQERAACGAARIRESLNSIKGLHKELADITANPLFMV